MGNVWGDDAEDTADEKRDLIPEGVHDAEVVGIVRGMSKTSEKAQLTLTFELFDGQNESMGKLKSWEPMEVGFRMAALRKALGRKGDVSIALGSMEDDSDGWSFLVGRSCQVKVKHEKFNGQFGHKVCKVLPALAGAQDDRPRDDDVSLPAPGSDTVDSDLPF